MLYIIRWVLKSFRFLHHTSSHRHQRSMNKIPNTNKDQAVNVNGGHKGTMRGQVQEHIGDKGYKKHIHNNKHNEVHGFKII